MDNKHEELSHDFEARDDFKKIMLQGTEINLSSLNGGIKTAKKMLCQKNLMNGPKIARHTQ